MIGVNAINTVSNIQDAKQQRFCEMALFRKVQDTMKCAWDYF